MALGDEEPSSSDESDRVDQDAHEITPWGTKREFTVCEEDRIFFMLNFNSTHLVTKRLPYLIVRTSSGILATGMMFERYYFDDLGVLWKGDGTERLSSVRYKSAQIGDPYDCTNVHGSCTVTVCSDEPWDGQYWVRELLGTRRQSDFEFFKANTAIPRCVRQLKVKTLEELAPYFNTDPLSVLAYLGRNMMYEANLKGNVSHLFAKSLGNANESVHVSPIPRSELEGVTLVRIDDTDYSPVYGKRVGYERMGNVFHVCEEGGCLRTIDDDALVG